MNGFELNPFLMKRWIWGIPAPIWLRKEELVGKFIAENKLKPVSPETLLADPMLTRGPMAGETQVRAMKLRRPSFPGGIRIAHLHFGGDIYVPKEEQWDKFSGAILQDFQARLSKAKNVSFEQMMELSEAIEPLR